MVSESIFNGKTCAIPLAEVVFVERSAFCDAICVVMKGSQHPTDRQGNYVVGFRRADCPYLNGEEAKAFMVAWCHYRAEVDGTIPSAMA